MNKKNIENWREWADVVKYIIHSTLFYDIWVVGMNVILTKDHAKKKRIWNPIYIIRE